MSRFLVMRYTQSPRVRQFLASGIAATLFLVAIYTYWSPSTSQRVYPIPDRTSPNTPPSEPELDSTKIWAERAEQVRKAFLHCYRGYEKYAFPHDELRPISKGQTDPFNGWGVTLVDSLDTMWLMGLKEEFKKATEFVAGLKFEMTPGHHAAYFETTIRYVGGLLSAFALSKDPIFLKKVDELAEKLEPVFGTKSGLPAFGVNTGDGTIERDQSAVLAEIGSFQLEYTYLAKLTGKKKFYDHVKNSQNLFHQADLNATGGMLPVHWNLNTGKPTDTSLSVGGEADSGHEYLLKTYLLTAKTDKASLEMYLRTTTYILTNLMFVTEKRHLLYVTKSTGSHYSLAGTPAHNFEHLACFLPGLLAVGAHTLPLDDLTAADLPRSLIDLLDSQALGSHAAEGYRALSSFSLKDIHLWAAEGLGQTCYLMYADQVTGLGPENAGMNTPDGKPAIRWIDVLQSWKKSGARGPPPGTNAIKPVKGHPELRDYYMRHAVYLLRPETMESMYMLWMVTGDSKWRERGWEMFQALEQWAKTDVGYAILSSVEYNGISNQQDSQPSYFLAEALKYLYLLFSEKSSQLPLDQWVYNTEAHPFPVFHWTEEEKRKFGI